MLVRKANQEDPDQTASVLGLHCLSRPSWQATLVFQKCSNIYCTCYCITGYVGSTSDWFIQEHFRAGRS